MKFLSISLIILFSSFIAEQNWHYDLDECKKIAQEKNQKIILVFSGSDWCAPCMKLEREILNTEVFKNYAKDHYVMLKADFPRKKANKLSKEQEKKNKTLASKYNQQGHFPSVVVLDHNGKVLGKTGYKKVSPEKYITTLNSFK